MFNGLNVKAVVTGIVLLVVLFTVVASTITYVTDAGDTINATGLPLANLFASDSILPILIMSALLLAVVGYLIGKK
jgi:hypothetical protein